MRSILYIGNKLSHLGFTPGVIETLGRQLESEGFKVYYTGTLRNQYLRLLQMLIKTFTLGRKVDYILIDTYSTNAFWYAFLTGMLARRLGTKYIPILHGGDLPSRIKKSKRACDKLFRKSHINIAVSGYLQNTFESYGYPVKVVPNNIVIANYPFKERAHPMPNLLWVRAFSKIYNSLMAIDVLVELQKTYPDASLCMVGPDKDGSLDEFITYAGSKGVSGSIKIKGILLKEEWIRLSSEYDFFINTTNFDNTPVSVIEAMALGMLIVSTNPGGIPFLLEADREAKLVDTGNSGAMVQAIGLMIEHKAAAASMSRAARKKAETFDSPQIINLWKEILV